MNITKEAEESQARIQPRGNREFHKLLQQAATIHATKSHDYASDDSPYANYEFAGIIAHQLFRDSPLDIGFCGRFAEKLYRISNLESNGKAPINETIEDTELDLVTIVTLWMAARREKRKNS